MMRRDIGMQYIPKDQRFHTSSEGQSMLKEIVKGTEQFHPFSKQVEVYMLALSVGIMNREMIPVKKEETLFVLETYSHYDEFGVYPLIIKPLYPNAEPEEIGDMIDKFAAAGLKALYREFKENGKIDFQALVSQSRKS